MPLSRATSVKTVLEAALELRVAVQPVLIAERAAQIRLLTLYRRSERRDEIRHDDRRRSQIGRAQIAFAHHRIAQQRRFEICSGKIDA